MHEIFSYFISTDTESDEKRLAYLYWFCDTFPPEEFRGEERIMREYAEYSMRLNVPFKSKYLSIYLSTELRKFLLESNVKIPATEGIDYTDPGAFENAMQICKEIMLNDLNNLEMREHDVNDFVVCAEVFMTERLNERTVEILGNTFNIIESTDNTMAAAEYALEYLQLINEIYDKYQLTDLIETLSGKRNNNEVIELLCDSGIPVFDNDFGGIYRTNLLGIEAQPGTGKTRMALGLWIYRAATVFHRNCLFFALEQKEEEVKAILVARHTFALYNISIDADLIWRNIVPDEYKDKVAAARLDLFESGKYGKIEVLYTNLYYESFITRIKTIDKLKGPFDLIAIDYMGLIDQIIDKEGYKLTKYIHRLEDYKIIGRSFKRFKRYLVNTGKAGIAISQFNQKGIEAGNEDKEITTDMAQGGIEVYRNTDNNLAMSMTPTMRLQNKRRVSQPKVRNSKGFGTCILDSRLGIGLFYQTVQNKI